MKVLILGGNTGFIGSHLSKKLKNPFECEFVSMRNLSWVKDHIETDCMINLVGKAHDFTGKATENDFFMPILNSQKAFDLFISSQATLFIHISSLAAIEEVESTKSLAENASYNAVSPYGRSKQAAEEWLLAQELPADKKLIILRPPMVHGSGDKGNLKQLFSIVSKGIPYPLVRFKNKRSFLSIDNFCFFIEQILLQNEKVGSGIYHLSDDETLSSNEIVKIMKEETGLKVPCFPLPKADHLLPIQARRPFQSVSAKYLALKKLTSNLVVSNKKIKVTLAIERLPKTAKEGLRETIRALKQQ